MLDTKIIYYTGNEGTGFSLIDYGDSFLIEIIDDRGKGGDHILFTSAEQVDDFIKLICEFKNNVFKLNKT